MTDNWTPDNVPILPLDRSLLAATKARPFRVGTAKATQADEDAIVALDDEFYRRVEEAQAAMERGAPGWHPPAFVVDRDAMQNRYEAPADWLGDFIELPYQVTYYFPSTVRNNRVGKGTYGKSGMTFRVLYEALCEGYNGGRKFIEDYFLSAFQDHMRPAYLEAVHDLKQHIADEAQRRRHAKPRDGKTGRFVHNTWLDDFETWSSPMTQETFKKLARETRKDIAASLQSGRVPLQKKGLSKRTVAARDRLGIAGDSVFYATGRLIRSIHVAVVLLDKNTASKAGKVYEDEVPF
jgi:hypothetical protein